MHMRPVTLADVDELHDDLWSHRTLTRSRNLVKRILDADEKHQGKGIVVVQSSSENDEDAGADEHNDADTETIIAYGQIRKWTRCAEISDLIVLEDHRSNGYGTAIIQRLVQIAHREIDATCIEIGAAKSNPRALALYRRLGFEDSYTLNLRIDKQAEPVIYLRLFFNHYLPDDNNPHTGSSDD